MAAAINYNDIMEIVKSNTSSMKVILDSVGSFVKACANIKKIDTKSTEKVLKDIKSLMPLISDIIFSIQFDNNDMIKQAKNQESILNAFNKNMEMIKFISSLAVPVDLPIKLLLIKSHIKNIMRFLKKSLSVNDGGFENGIENLKKIQEIFSKNFVETFAAINNIKLSEFVLLRLKLNFIKNGILDIKNFILTLPELDIKSVVKNNIQNSLNDLNGIINSIKLLFDTLSQFKSIIFLSLKLKIIRGVLISIFNTINLLQSLIDNSKISKTYSNKLDVVKMIFNSIGGIFLSILLITPISLAASSIISVLIGTIKRLTLAINMISNIVNSIKTEKRLVKDITIIGVLFSTMGLAFLTIILVTPIILTASLAMLLVLGGIALISLSLWMMSKLLMRLPWMQLILGLAALNLIMLAITSLSVMLLVVALCSTQVAPNFLNILILLGSIITVTLLVGVMGLLFSTVLLPLTIPTLLGLGAMTLILGMVSIMSAMLLFISTISIDKERVFNNVNVIIGTAKQIISMLFSEKDQEANKATNPWYEQMFGLMGNGITSVISLIMSVAILAMTVVAVGLISFMAIQLRMLQELNLDNTRITSNVSIILNTVKDITTKLFAKDDTKTNPKNDGVFKKLLNFVSPELSKISDTIMAVGVLGTTVIAVGMLRNIADQLISINKLPSLGSIKSKVSSLLKSSNSVIEMIVKDDSLKDINNKQLNKLNTLKKLTSSINDIYNIAVKIPKLDASVLNGNKDNFSTIIDTVNMLDSDWNVDVKIANKRIDVLFRVHKLMNKFQKFSKDNIDSSKQVMDNYIKFVDKIGNTDLENLKTTENIFKRMAEFSKSINGDFEKLAESLNEKIMPILEKLESSINNMNESVSDGISKVNNNIVESNMTIDTYNSEARAKELQESGMNPVEIGEQIRQELIALRKKDNKKELKDIYDLLSGVVNSSKTKLVVQTT